MLFYLKKLNEIKIHQQNSEQKSLLSAQSDSPSLWLFRTCPTSMLYLNKSLLSWAAAVMQSGKSGNTYWRLMHIHQWSGELGSAQGQLAGQKGKKVVLIMELLQPHFSKVAAAATEKRFSFHPAGTTPRQHRRVWTGETSASHERNFSPLLWLSCEQNTILTDWAHFWAHSTLSLSIKCWSLRCWPVLVVGLWQTEVTLQPQRRANVNTVHTSS